MRWAACNMHLSDCAQTCLVLVFQAAAHSSDICRFPRISGLRAQAAYQSTLPPAAAPLTAAEHLLAARLNAIGPLVGVERAGLKS